VLMFCGVCRPSNTRQSECKSGTWQRRLPVGAPGGNAWRELMRLKSSIAIGGISHGFLNDRVTLSSFLALKSQRFWKPGPESHDDVMVRMVAAMAKCFYGT